MNRRIKNIRCKLSDEIRGIKGNYLDRFTGVIQTMNENHI